MTASDDATPAALISSGDLTRRLVAGQSLRFGRAPGNDLRIGHSPEDRRVPRTAGLLECRDDGVLIHNLSDKRTLTVATFPGPGYEILPMMVTGTHPHPLVRLSLTGAVTEYRITIDLRGLGPARTSPAGADGSAPTAGFQRIPMKPRQRFFLTALCLPVMTSSGPRGQVPSYAAMEELMVAHGHPYRAKTIRNNLDELRAWLTHEHDIPDLTGVERLAHWAIRSGNVTDTDLERFADDT
ncbi:hypothetical protein Aph02nite_07290 [Actinoplanes philippinensis]|uniref:Uncharacterized protein n=1 Tax=Actinoplanes philippinensis TaxID=35752 RepID=A0A1I2CNG0_9ACTN|nr:hypothetical protein [Actinoplanes philippinensis]GIE74779.1 hypothetical protein Aph02nite_07290 [Actinoplanes philippinensis]SFE69774.1 hypothetical protein SAMN05421541_103103 [Actinoplanes philippinensis]